ncbi:MAG: S8 family serine peptidase [Bdellovibrionales bacterium]|jgi:thermitase|nr:S8 family serine peptidase [Bdellovibrionales bacterium]MBT3525670.1 S8 family serine peptidase [Bdellovibrionales bacterium]MBT7668198.1 S8 family serine peptidase [Bdellovibrionales bacterium]MBT7768114.1 S8 family serine peptidase [Bdellovibrionales bacterium]
MLFRIWFSLAAITLSFNTIAAEYIIQFTSTKSAQLIAKQMNLQTFTALGSTFAKIKTDNPRPLENNPNILRIEPNITYRTFDDSWEEVTDPKFNMQWALSNQGMNEPVKPDQLSPLPGTIGCDISAQRVWSEITTGSDQIIIAVMDTGIDYNHPELKNSIWVNLKEQNGLPGIDDDGNGHIDDIHGYDAFNDDGDPMDDKGHGTHCAGIIGASHDGKGIMGVMDKVKLLPIKMMNHKGRGELEHAIKAMDYFAKSPARVVNCSWGSNLYSEIFQEMIVKLEQRGKFFVAAAGNLRGRNNDQHPTYPANYQVPNLISISSHNARARHSHFSTYGPKTIHIAAPGTKILSTYIKEKRKPRYKVASGTSMAAPFVTAAVGLLLHQAPNLTGDEIRNRLMETAIKEHHLTPKNITGARLDLYRLLMNIRTQTDE